MSLPQKEKTLKQILMTTKLDFGIETKCNYEITIDVAQKAVRVWLLQKPVTLFDEKGLTEKLKQKLYGISFRALESPYADTIYAIEADEATKIFMAFLVEVLSAERKSLLEELQK